MQHDRLTSPWQTPHPAHDLMRLWRSKALRFYVCHGVIRHRLVPHLYEDLTTGRYLPAVAPNVIVCHELPCVPVCRS